MEQFVLGIFQEQLSKFIVGFRKEQINANILNGKGEIHNVELNCSFLNDTLTKITPYLALERVHVSKLSFHVSSWTNIRKAPILIDIGHVDARAVEPLHYNADGQQQRRRVRQVRTSEFIQMIKEGFKPSHKRPYNVFDRIMDNLTIEIASVTIHFQPLGKFKTQRVGPWTPPEIECLLAGVRVVSVNEYGQEAPPDEVWSHNQGDHRTFLLYKKLEMEYQISLRPAGATASIPLISGGDNKIAIQVAMRRRIRDGQWMSCQVDTVIPHVEVDIPAHVVPHIAHAVAGVAFCVAKDRAFTDPLKVVSSEQQQQQHDAESEPLSVTISVVESQDVDDPEDAIEDGAVSDDGEDLADMASDEGVEDDMIGDDRGESPASTPKRQSLASNNASPDYYDRPVIVFPNGLVIHEKLSFSVSILHATVRGTYAPAEDGHVELVAKGCIAEAIWPRESKERGGYLQASAAFVSVKERYQQRIRTLMVGGVEFNEHGPVEQPGKPMFVVGRDETFPLYEDRSIRPDPLGLRHTFPAQAFGAKTTIEFLPRVSPEQEGEGDQIKTVHEIGIDRFEIVLEANSWCRMLRFALNESGGGFDQRWYSGDWTEVLTPDMLVRPKAALNLDEILQKSRQIFLDANQFISSDLFNATLRQTNVVLRIPAALDEDVRSCDVVLKMDETTLVVSSALPRTFLSGKIGTSVNGDDSTKKGVIEFPNDPSDVGYVLENSEDPSDRQRGVATSKAISTFRLQLTHRGLSIRLQPVIPVNSAKEPQQLLAPTELTLIACFEGEPPESEQSKLTKIVLFTSVLVHRCEVNIDLDLIAAALSTLSSHVAIIDDTWNVCRILLDPKRDTSISQVSIDKATSSSGKIRRSIRGRHVLVRRHLDQSRQTGGLSIAFCLQIAESHLSIWRQNVPFSSPLRSKSSKQQTDSAESESSSRYAPLLKVLGCDMNWLEVGIEGVFRGEHRRLVGKMCLSEMSVEMCDWNAWLCDRDAWVDAGVSLNADVTPPERSTSSTENMVQVLTLGRGLGKEESAVSLRLEEQSEQSRSWSIAVDVVEGAISCRVEELEILALLVLEAFLAPAWSKRVKQESGFFPDGTIGALFMHFVPSSIAVTVGSSLRSDFGSSDIPDTRVPGRRVDNFLRVFIARIVPKNVQLALLRVSLKSFLTHIPFQATSDRVVAPSGFGFLVNELDFIASNVLSTRKRDDVLLDVVARKGETWSTLVDTTDQGLRHRLTARQGLLQLEDPAVESSREILVDPFDFGYTYANSKASISMTPGPTIQNAERLEDFLSCLHGFAARCRSFLKNAIGIVSSLNAKVGDLGQSGVGAPSNPTAVACETTTSAIRQVRKLLRVVNQQVAVYDSSVHTLLEEKQKEIDQLKQLVFSKEKERIGAIALVSSQAAGWLRIGSPQRSGQRGLMTATLWPHWCVLRGSLIFLYSAPGQMNPIDIVSLSAASTRELTGGRRKRDLKRAFALVESSGLARFVVAGTDAEYYKWVREIQRETGGMVSSTMTDPSGESSQPEDASSGMLGSSTDSTVTESNSTRSFSDSTVGREDDTNEQNEQKGRLQQRLGRFGKGALQAARQIGRDVKKNPAMPFRASEGASVSSRRSAGWTCFRCTFVNETGGDKCEMCGQGASTENSAVFRLDEKTVSSDGTESANGEVRKQLSQQLSMDSDVGVEMDETGAPRRGVRVRLGTAAVKSVRLAKGLGENLRRRGPAGRQEVGEGSQVGAPDPIKLRNVSLSGPLDLPPRLFGDPGDETFEMPLKKLEGLWTVRVELANVAEASDMKVDVDGIGAGGPAQNDPAVGATFRVQVFRATADSPLAPIAAVLRKVPDILTLHTQLSESISRLPLNASNQQGEAGRTALGDMNASLAHKLGLTPLDTVRLTGKLLGGILDSTTPSPSKTELEYHAAVISEFLGSILDCALPVDGLAAVTDFLGIASASSINAEAQDDEPRRETPPSDFSRQRPMASEIFALSRTCETEILRAENQSLVAERLSGTINTEHETVEPVAQYLAHATPVGSSSRFQEAMHVALMKVMEERDEAHARMVAAGVLHVHETEQQRKKINNLTSQLQANGSRDSDDDERRRKEKQAMQQNMDEELVSLCQNLASEISARTSADLEIIRLKENRKIERENELSEKEAMEEEVRRLREVLSSEQKKTNEARREASNWKDSYLQVIQTLETDTKASDGG